MSTPPDDTDRLRSEIEALQKKVADLAQAEARYLSLIENLDEIIFTIDLGGKVTFASRSTETILGYSKEQAVGMNILDFLPQHEKKRALETLPQGMEGTKITHYYTEALTKAGTTVLLELTFSRLYENDEVVGALAVAQDVTERKALEQRLRQAQKMEAVGRLAGGVAHDFNNALTPIMVISDILLIKFPPEDPIHQDIKEIRDAGERCANLTRQLLAFGWRQVMELHVLNLNPVVTNMERMLARLIGEDIQFVKFLDPGLGSVKADSGQIEQIIMNLAINARDAMPRGGKLTIETANVQLDQGYADSRVAVEPGDYIMLAVSDTGQGMDEQTRAQIFEPFYTTKAKEKGSGLGLSTVYGIVKQSGGNIWCYSEPGRGTTFKIYLPRVEQETEFNTKPRPAPPAVPAASETILLVEDEANVRKAARRILEKHGYQIIEAESGVQALKMFQDPAQTIDLVITDVVMPGMSGKQMAEKIIAVRPDTKIIYLSGHTENAIAHQGVLDPKTHFIPKPFSAEALCAKVREVLDL